jgi:hypothetical protein
MVARKLKIWIGIGHGLLRTPSDRLRSSVRCRVKIALKLVARGEARIDGMNLPLIEHLIVFRVYTSECKLRDGWDR